MKTHREIDNRNLAMTRTELELFERQESRGMEIPKDHKQADYSFT